MKTYPSTFKRVRKKCRFCGRVFYALPYSSQKYCNPEHRKQHHNAGGG